MYSCQNTNSYLHPASVSSQNQPISFNAKFGRVIEMVNKHREEKNNKNDKTKLEGTNKSIESSIETVRRIEKFNKENIELSNRNNFKTTNPNKKQKESINILKKEENRYVYPHYTHNKTVMRPCMEIGMNMIKPDSQRDSSTKKSKSSFIQPKKNESQRSSYNKENSASNLRNTILEQNQVSV